ncbi:hypothetical protein [Yoonia vestfoldensis]|uniref:hypothetical protein n=1 Tax=Yoonia vestfoldensis TaxID=245188 RepID=UPI000362DABA|nr:hypothetical protein [Yoonia vestfoldensis]
MKRIATISVILTLLSGCAVDPQAAAERRENLMVSVFPQAADRQGLFLVFPLESGRLYDTLLITHFVDEVSRQEVVNRVARYCAGLGSPRLSGQATLVRELGTATRPRSDGTQGTTLEARYDCTEA